MEKSGKINSVLKSQLKLVNLDEKEISQLEENTRKILNFIKQNIKNKKILADVFLGGSFAKNTMIKKEKYDIDIFVRFDSKYKEEELSCILEKIVPKKSRKLHGSRDYFSLKTANMEFEIIPVLKIKNPEEARNITDLSYFHVGYVRKKIEKNKKIASEIKLAKKFVYASGCYGAESYISGFSGYGLELLIIHYKSLMGFIKAVAKTNFKDNKNEKTIIDDEKHYKGKEDILRNMNEAKLLSPIIVIDPTFRERNALSALSSETFLKFRNFCLGFLRNPSSDFFIVGDRESEFCRKYKKFIKIELKTKKQAGDIAGTKMKKFYGFFVFNLARFFDVRASEFIYEEKENIGKILLSVEVKKEIIFPGPPVKMKEQLSRFKKEHRKIKIIKNRAFAYEKPISFRDWFDDFKVKNERVIEDMDVNELRII
jgi:tRNA nucleotidyltransferase (CCA-adding enzyme)